MNLLRRIPSSPEGLLSPGARVAIASLLTWAAVAKLLDGQSEPSGLGTASQRLLGDGAAHDLLPYAELIVAAGLLWGRTSAPAARVLIIALSLGIGLFVSEMMRPDPLPCGCFGIVPTGDTDSTRLGLGLAVLRNLGLIGLCAWVVTREAEPSKVPVPFRGVPADHPATLSESR